MEYIHIKNLDRYNPGYKDRNLIWCKIYFSMLNASPDFEMLEETDKWRFVAFIMMEIQAKQPIPVDNFYLARKGFDLEKRPISLTLKVLHNFITLVTENDMGAYRRVDKSREEKKRVGSLIKKTSERMGEY